LGAARADVTFEQKPNGGRRGIVTWLAKVAQGENALMTARLSSLDTNRPTLRNETPLFVSSASRGASLESDSRGTRLIVKDPDGELQMFFHDASKWRMIWQEATPGIALSSTSGFPTATVLPWGTTIVAVESDTDEHIVTVQRWKSPAHDAALQQTLEGYSEPTITTDGKNVWVIAVRVSDGDVISRQVFGRGWKSASDLTEVDASQADSASHPNAMRRHRYRLRFIVRGHAFGTSRSGVLALQRRY
jgi:hypothetical protein